MPIQTAMSMRAGRAVAGSDSQPDPEIPKIRSTQLANPKSGL